MNSDLHFQGLICDKKYNYKEVNEAIVGQYRLYLNWIQIFRACLMQY